MANSPETPVMWESRNPAARAVMAASTQDKAKTRGTLTPMVMAAC